MKKMIFLGLLMLSSAYATPPVTLSGPSPALESSYTPNTSTLVTYTVTNYVPKNLPLTVSGLSSPLQRTTVAHDCGSSLPAGPSTCNIGVTISPSVAQVGTNVKQTLVINYQGRTSLTSSIAFSVSEPPQTFAYVTPALAATSIDQFLLASNGSLSTSSPAYTSPSSETFGQMTFATVNGVQHPYILDPAGAVYWCNINSDGSFSNCNTTSLLPTVGTWFARAIAFATFNQQYAYITDPGNYYVYQCTVNAAGDFSSCQQNSLAFGAPYGITFTTDANGEQHAYVADADTGSGSGGAVWQCSMNNDGSFNTCAQTPSSGAPSWVPYATAFTTVNGTQYAYVADNGSGSPGHVYRCSLNSDGSFVNSSCTQTPADESSLTNWYPYYIAFKTLNGTQYAYVVNSSGSSIGNIYRCVVDNDGSLTDCEMTPSTTPGSWQPSGIAFR